MAPAGPQEANTALDQAGADGAYYEAFAGALERFVASLDLLGGPGDLRVPGDHAQSSRRDDPDG